MEFIEMKESALRFNTPALTYFSEVEMQTIHSASLDILEDCGTLVHHDEARELLMEAGAFPKEDHRICIPTGLVEWAVQRAPSRVTVYDRNGLPAMFLENTNVYFGTGSDVPRLIDSFTGELRDFTYKDVEDAVRLVDALPHIDFTMSNGLAPDIATSTQYQYKYAAMIRNTVKPQVITAENRTVLNDIANIAAAVVGGREELTRKPLFVLYAEPTSPLVHSFDALDKLLFMAENRLPTNYAPGMMAGGTGPVTMAGAITLATAEILTGLVIHQLKRPGAPFIFGAGMSPLDMQSMQPTYSAPEAMMTQAGLCQLGRHLYRLPTWGFGGCSASKLADEQAVNEAATYIMMAGWAGTNLVHDVGYLEFGLAYSFDLLIVCDEIISQVRKMMDGIKVDTDTLAVEAVKRVGPGGHFLSDEHTFDHFKNNWQPRLTDRKTREVWEQEGKKSMGQRAKEKLENILKNHCPPELTSQMDSEIDDILKSAEKRSQVDASGD